MWGGRGGTELEPQSRRGAWARWAHFGSFLREVSLPPRCQEPLVPRQERKRTACCQPGAPWGRQDVRAPDPAGVRGRGPRGLPRAAPTSAAAAGAGSRLRPQRRRSAGPAPPARARPGGSRGRRSSGERAGLGAAPRRGCPAGRPLSSALSRDHACSRPWEPLRALMPFLAPVGVPEAGWKRFPWGTGSRGEVGQRPPDLEGRRPAELSSVAVPENEASCWGCPRVGAERAQGSPRTGGSEQWERVPGAVRGTHAGPRGLFAAWAACGHGRQPAKTRVPSWCVLAKGLCLVGVPTRGSGASTPARRIVALGRFLSPANLSPGPRPGGLDVWAPGDKLRSPLSWGVGGPATPEDSRSGQR